MLNLCQLQVDPFTGEGGDCRRGFGRSAVEVVAGTGANEDTDANEGTEASEGGDAEEGEGRLPFLAGGGCGGIAANGLRGVNLGGR